MLPPHLDTTYSFIIITQKVDHTDKEYVDGMGCDGGVYVEGMDKINRFPNPITHNKSVMQILLTSSRT